MIVRDTLLLDQGYQPLRVIPWQRALCMHFVGKVEVVTEHRWSIRTIARAFPAPAVVRLLRNVKVRPLYVRFSRENVYLRDGHRCQYCGKHCRAPDLTLDHVLPRSRGGKTHWRNVVTCCVKCNRKKGRATPVEADMPLRQDPVRPKWLSAKIVTLGEHELPEAWLDFLH
jgi:5-methylcytosine-specific restriction endonuclease McrA